ncbi:MAG: HNH endonuclease [Anaerolineae bacterium]
MRRRRPIPGRLRQAVAERAGHRCSYCRSPEMVGVPMAIDHIIPLKVGGSSDFDNLCLACYRCNEFKGAKTEAPDPSTGELTPLFDPATQQWYDHFTWSEDGLLIIGKTPSARATIEALRLNSDWIVQARRIWIRAGLHPPLE